MTNLREFHRWRNVGTIRWRCDSTGLEIEGPGEGTGYQRTPGKPMTMAKIWDQWAVDIQEAAYTYSVPVELLMTTAATEGGMYLNNPKQDRKEPGYVSDEATPNRVSIGLCHILLSTARFVMNWPGMSRRWLEQPQNNFAVAAAVLRADAPITGFDVVLCAAKYNAGSLRETTKNRWGLFTHGNHLDRATKFYGDAVAFIADKGGAKRDVTWMLKGLDQGTLL